MSVQLMHGDWIECLRNLPADSVHCCVTSPPYYGLRDYGVAGQIGLESTPQAYIEALVAGFEEVKRVLRDDGTLWLNIGDSYNAAGRTGHGSRNGVKQGTNRASAAGIDYTRSTSADLKPKDPLMIPARLAIALQEAGWYLRSDIIWAKPNPMPESVTDRPTSAHEHIFLLAKCERYYYDSEAIKEPVTGNAHERGSGINPKAKKEGRNSRLHQDRDPNHSDARKVKQNVSFSAAVTRLVDTRNRRNVWTVATHPCKEAHFATFPPELIKPCVLAGCPVDGTVLDPFFGAGTTGVVCVLQQRNCIGIEINEDYLCIAQKRIADAQAQGMLDLSEVTQCVNPN